MQCHNIDLAVCEEWKTSFASCSNTKDTQEVAYTPGQSSLGTRVATAIVQRSPCAGSCCRFKHHVSQTDSSRITLRPLQVGNLSCRGMQGTPVYKAPSQGARAAACCGVCTHISVSTGTAGASSVQLYVTCSTWKATLIHCGSCLGQLSYTATGLPSSACDC